MAIGLRAQTWFMHVRKLRSDVLLRSGACHLKMGTQHERDLWSGIVVRSEEVVDSFGFTSAQNNHG